jgi:hypothetical protein
MSELDQLQHDLRRVCAGWSLAEFVVVADVLAAELLSRGQNAGKHLARASVELQVAIDNHALAHDVARVLR